MNAEAGGADRPGESRPAADLTDLLPDVWRGSCGVPTPAAGP